MVTLKSGTRLAGFFGRESLVSDFPREKDLFIERAFKVDKDGNLSAEVEDNRGIYVAPGEISFVEFVRGENTGDRAFPT